MNRSTRARLRAPLVVWIAGTIVAGAVAIGHTWADALIAEVVTVVLGGAYYLLSASHSDIGDIYAHREDERQNVVAMKARSVACVVMIAAAFVSAVYAVAANKNYWQADVIASLGGLSYFLTLLFSGARDGEPGPSSEGMMAARRPGERVSESEDSTSG